MSKERLVSPKVLLSGAIKVHCYLRYKKLGGKGTKE